MFLLLGFNEKAMTGDIELSSFADCLVDFKKLFVIPSRAEIWYLPWNMLKIVGGL